MSKTDSAPDPIDTYVGRRLRMFRDQAKITQSTLAEAGGVSFQQIQKYERGHNRISASMLCHLAGRLGVRVSDLLPREFEGTPTAPLSASAEAAAQLVEQMSPESQRFAVILLRKLAAADSA
jgi:transcriptional regulator with XRE-family HTH domain